MCIFLKVGTGPYCRNATPQSGCVAVLYPLYFWQSGPILISICLFMWVHMYCTHQWPKPIHIYRIGNMIFVCSFLVWFCLKYNLLFKLSKKKYNERSFNRGRRVERDVIIQFIEAYLGALIEGVEVKPGDHILLEPDQESLDPFVGTVVYLYESKVKHGTKTL